MKLGWKDGKTCSQNAAQLSHTLRQCWGEQLVDGLKEKAVGAVVATDLKKVAIQGCVAYI